MRKRMNKKSEARLKAFALVFFIVAIAVANMLLTAGYDDLNASQETIQNFTGENGNNLSPIEEVITNIIENISGDNITNNLSEQINSSLENLTDVPTIDVNETNESVGNVSGDINISSSNDTSEEIPINDINNSISNETLNITANITSNITDKKIKHQLKDSKKNKIDSDMIVLKDKGNKKDIKITPRHGPVKNIVIENISDENISLGIDDVPESAMKNSVEVYAIDPTQLNFSEATVTATAKGYKLWKCKDWNFDEQKCYGEWVKLMDIFPGQDYSFTLTPDDPGFSETGGIAIGIPNTNLAFFISSEGYMASNGGGTHTDDFDEVPIQLNDYGSVTEKCGNWNCSFWNQSVGNDVGTYCIGGWNCTQWNGVSCSSYKCNNWTVTLPIRTVNYCDGGWSCQKWNNSVCQSWNCSKYIASGSTYDMSCQGNWSCTSWDGDHCSKWGCTKWTNGTTIEKDTFCASSWNCLSFNGTTCSSWNCSNWSEIGIAQLDVYCQGGWNCSNWNNNVCSNWSCIKMNATGTINLDYYCKQWNCSNWNDNTRACNSWGCLNWSASASRLDMACEGSWDCKSWAIFDIFPTANLISPPNGNINASTTIDFACNASDDVQLSNITFYWNYSGSFIANGTNVVSRKANNTNFTRDNLANSQIMWNCYACDNASQCSFAPSNYTVRIDTSAPKWSNNKTNVSFYTKTGDSVYFNVTFTELYPANYKFAINQTGSWQNFTGTYTSGVPITNITTITAAEGAFVSWYFWASNTPGQNNMTDIWNFTVADTTNPKISFGVGTENDDSYFNRDWVYTNISVIEINEANVTFAIYNSTWSNVTVNTTAAQRTINWTGLGNGIYYYNVSGYDIYGNFNKTETRKITLDHVAPNITIHYPANNSYHPSNTIKLNFTIVDSSPSSWIGYSLNETANVSISLNTSLNISVEIGGASVSNSNQNVSQSFIPQETMDIKRLAVRLQKLNLGLTNPKIQIRTDFLDQPSGSVLAEGSIDNNIVPYPYSWISVDLNGTVRLTAGSKYWIFLTPNGDATNYYQWEVNQSNVYSNGEYNKNSGWDLLFRVYDQYRYRTVITASEGLNNITVSANDSAGNMNISDFTYFIVDTVKPAWSNNSTNSSNITTGDFVYFNVTFTDLHPVNYKFAINQSGSWQNFTGTYTSGVPIQNITTITASPGAYVSWYFWANDSVGNSNMTDVWSFVVKDKSSPVWNNNMTNVSNTTRKGDRVYFNVTFTDLYPANYIFAINQTGSWQNFTGTYTSGVPIQNITTITANEGTYISWYFWANDTYGNTNQTDIWSFVIADSTPPYIAFGAGTEQNDSYFNRTWIYVNVTVIDINEKNTTFRLYNSSGNLVNETAYTDVQKTVNWTSLVDGVYYYNVTAYDIYNNYNYTETRKITLDNTNPKITFGAGTENNDSYFNRNWIYANVSVIELHELNITFRLYNSSFDLINETSNITAQLRTINWTGLTNGTYYYNVGVIDVVNNTNYTETRKITLDTTYPKITFGAGTELNNTYKGRDWVYVNVSINEINEANVTFAIYNSTWSNVTVNTTAAQRTINWTGLGNGIYYYNVSVYDKAYNFNYTETRKITLDTVYPKWSNNSTNVSFYTKTGDSVYFNITFTNTNPGNYKFAINQSGSWVNYTGSWTSGVAITNISTITASEGSYVSWYFWANDSAENSNMTDMWSFIVADSTNPKISFGIGTELNDSYFARNWVYVNVSVTEINAANVTFAIYNSTWSNVTVNTTAAQRTINWTGLGDGIYYYNVTVWDLYNNYNSTETRKITLDNTNPKITFGVGTESNNSYESRNWIYANVSVIEINEANETFAIYNSTWSNVTVNTTANQRFINWTNLANDTYYYNVTIYDYAGNYNLTETRKITLDTTYPQISFNAGTELNDSYESRNWIYANVSLTEINEANVTFELYNATSGALLNRTLNTTAAQRFLNWTNRANGEYYYNVSVYDRAGNLNYTETRKITLDNTNPKITFGSGTENNNSYESRDWVYVNVSVTEINEANVTFRLYNSSFDLINETSNITVQLRTINWTDLAQGTYYYNVSVIDIVNNSNYTETRKITLDTMTPIINLTSPVDGNYYNVSSIDLNFTIIENTVISIIKYKLNNTNYTLSRNDSYEIAPAEVGDADENDFTYENLSQSFTPEKNMTVREVSIYIKRNLLGGPNTVLQIRTDDGGNPSTTVLATALIINNSVPQTYSWVNLTLNKTINLSKDVSYWLFMGPKSTSPNFYFWKSNSSDPSPGNYSNDASKDLLFIVYDYLDYRKTLSLADNFYNLTVFVNDSANNLGNSSTASFVVDTKAPQYKTPSETDPLVFSQTQTIRINVTDATLGVDTVLIEFDSANHTMIYGSGNIYNYSWTPLLPGTVNYRIYMNDTTNNKNVTPQYSFYVNDTGGAPDVSNITYSPNITESLDPNVRIYVNATINDSNLDTVLLLTRHENSSSWNTTIMSNTSNLFNASFNATLEGIWYFKISANDTGALMTNSSTYIVPVVYEGNWSRNPADFGTVSAVAGNTVQLGNLTVTSLADMNLTFDLRAISASTSQTWTRIQYNTTEPFTLGYNQSKTIAISTTTDSNWPAGSYDIIIITNATNASAYPDYENTTVSLVLTTIPIPVFEISIFEYDSSPTQGDSAVVYKARVKNVGTAAATNGSLNWTLPLGFTNSTGSLMNATFSNLDIGEVFCNNVTVNIDSGAATGSKTISINASCAENVSSSDSKTITVNAAPAATVVSGGGGGGGGFTKAEVEQQIEAEKVVVTKTVHIVRGEKESFDIEIFNKFTDKNLEGLELSMIGFISKYISVSPTRIEKIEPGQSAKFVVKIIGPIYGKYSEQSLNATIRGSVVKEGTIKGSISSEYLETQYITLIIHEISQNETRQSLTDAENALNLMRNETFNIGNAEDLLASAKEKLAQGRYEEAAAIAAQIEKIKKDSILADNLLRRIMEVENNPGKTSLLLAKGLKEFDSSFEGLSLKEISGKIQFSNAAITEMMGLAIVAFERGDYATALERAEKARTLMLFEKKGSLFVFFYNYWYIIATLILVLAISGFVGYRQYQKVSVVKRIDELNSEEDNVRALVAENQKNYFARKIGPTEYHRLEGRYDQKLVRLREIRTKLRGIRVRLMRPAQVKKDLEIEKRQVFDEIKRLQELYYEKKRISENEYAARFRVLEERLAEVEGERITTEVMSREHKEKLKLAKEKVQEKIEEEKKKAERVIEMKTKEELERAMAREETKRAIKEAESTEEKLKKEVLKSVEKKPEKPAEKKRIEIKMPEINKFIKKGFSMISKPFEHLKGSKESKDEKEKKRIRKEIEDMLNKRR